MLTWICCKKCLKFKEKKTFFSQTREYKKNHIFTWKYELQADKTTLCACNCLPSAANVTSTSVSLCKSVEKTEIKFGWWLFQRRQYCWTAITFVLLVILPFLLSQIFCCVVFLQKSRAGVAFTCILSFALQHPRKLFWAHTILLDCSNKDQERPWKKTTTSWRHTGPILLQIQILRLFL